MVHGNPIGLTYNDISLAFTVMLELMSYMPELLYDSPFGIFAFIVLLSF